MLSPFLKDKIPFILLCLVSPLLFILSLVYWIVIKIRSFMYQRDWFKRYHLDIPVISIGNIRVGGSGKTPMISKLIHFCLEEKLTPVVLTRGYKGGLDRDGFAVIRNGLVIFLENSSAHIHPDEAFLISRQFPEVDVIVGSQRFRNFQRYRKRFPKRKTQCVLLDDGFQHLALKRDVDIVMLDGKPNYGFNGLLPFGHFREPPSALKRAHFKLLGFREPSTPESISTFLMNSSLNENNKFLKNKKENDDVFAICLSTSAPHNALHPEQILSPQKNVFLVCGIARPELLVNALLSKGFEFQSQVFYEDHELFEISELKENILNASYVITTNKDYYRQIDFFSNLARPVYLVDVEIEFMDDHFWEMLRKKII